MALTASPGRCGDNGQSRIVDIGRTVGTKLAREFFLVDVQAEPIETVRHGDDGCALDGS